MKKILLSAVAVMAFGVAAQAQSEEMKFGVKAGLNLTNFTGDFDEADGATSFYVGGLVDLPVSGNFHVQPELLYSMEGADKASLSYLRVPIMAKYYVMEGLSLQAGPEVAFKVAAENDLMDEATKSIDFGIGAGVAYELPMGLFFDARYNLGLSNISESDQVDFKNTGIQIGLGWRF
jgi:opacity protein-like surface antigen